MWLRKKWLPEAPMMPQRPPVIAPLILLMIDLGSFPLLGLVDTDKLFQVRTAGASAGVTAVNSPFSSI